MPSNHSFALCVCEFNAIAHLPRSSECCLSINFTCDCIVLYLATIYRAARGDNPLFAPEFEDCLGLGERTISRVAERMRRHVPSSWIDSNSCIISCSVCTHTNTYQTLWIVFISLRIEHRAPNEWKWFAWWRSIQNKREWVNKINIKYRRKITETNFYHIR